MVATTDSQSRGPSSNIAQTRPLISSVSNSTDSMTGVVGPSDGSMPFVISLVKIRYTARKNAPCAAARKRTGAASMT